MATYNYGQPEAPSRTLQTWVQEMLERKRMGARAGAGGDRDGKYLWLYFSLGEAMESRILIRPVIKEGEAVLEVHRMEGEAAPLQAQISRILTGL